eukprot:TRINITY_DN705_c0_g1_i1.p3 TRINITY_DN705_c0_g1~~TRINITY_DN705_c0_g1_i1.p3  ORF type:complete len:163 (+),score=17.35 TRINITY_DN705_c0_g1_i1:824-1312(+)
MRCQAETHKCGVVLTDTRAVPLFALEPQHCTQVECNCAPGASRSLTVRNEWERRHVLPRAAVAVSRIVARCRRLPVRSVRRSAPDVAAVPRAAGVSVASAEDEQQYFEMEVVQPAVFLRGRRGACYAGQRSRCLYHGSSTRALQAELRDVFALQPRNVVPRT